MGIFKWSFIITFLGIVTAFWWDGTKAVFITSILVVLEISLSFENAVINATSLQKMSQKWQTRFLTWGIFIAVFIVRFILPIVLISVIAKMGPLEVLELSLHSPTEYAKHLQEAQYALGTFGGLFLLLVFLSFIFDHKRTVHWLGKIEKKLSEMGTFSYIELLIATTILGILYSLAPPLKQTEVLVAGLAAIVLWSFLHVLTNTLQVYNKLHPSLGIVTFCYLEVLDASFSLDGVIGAFAITKDIVIIMLGLTIGALFVRSLTVYLVQKGTLQKYRFLEHGAFYAIGALSCIMLISPLVHISEIVIGLIGVVFIGLAITSSVLHNKKFIQH